MRIIFLSNCSLFYKTCVYFLIGFLLLFSLSQPVFSDEISDARDLYGDCLIERKEALSTCRQIYLETLDKFLEEIWAKFLKRHEIFGNKAALNGRNIIIDDVLESQKKWREYEKFACRHLFTTSVFGTNGPDLFFTGCRALVIKQRIEMLRHAFCAGEDYNACEKQWGIEEKPRKPNDKKVDANK